MFLLTYLLITAAAAKLKHNLIFVNDVKCRFGVDASERNEDAWQDTKDDSLHGQTAKSFLLINAEEEAASNQTTTRHDGFGHMSLENQHRENDDKNDGCWPRNLSKSYTHAAIILSLHRSTCISWQLQVRTGGVYWSKVLLPTDSCNCIWVRQKTLEFSTGSLTSYTTAWQRGVGATSLVSINEVNLCWARLVLGWVTVSGFDSRRRHFISVCNQPPRSTQPSTLRGMV